MCFLVNVIASPEAVTRLIWSNFLEGWACSTVFSMLIGLFIKRPQWMAILVGVLFDVYQLFPGE